jgi:uncharacterized BrkB/YihY/UPF0761 family membrane protein
MGGFFCATVGSLVTGFVLAVHAVWKANPEDKNWRIRLARFYAGSFGFILFLALLSMMIRYTGR